jgi:hypothetical protein
LEAGYRLSETDQAFIWATARGNAGRLTLAILLKARQDFGCFLPAADAHSDTVEYLASQLGLADLPPLITEEISTKTFYRYRAAVRTYLNVSPYSEVGQNLVVTTVLKATETMSDPADLINRAVEELCNAAIDLPAFSTLDRLANHIRTQVHARMYDQVTARLTADHIAALDALLSVASTAMTTGFNRLKQTPGPARAGTIRLWTDRLAWLNGLIDPAPLLKGIY